jgi:glycosyltransferase involved in cell wall biosynthesis
MRFALVIPALNEEQAIAATLLHALAARAKVLSETSVTEMTIVFVNDGSTDRTQEIVDQPQFDEVVKIRLAKNRGYGAAIKAGWQATDAELLGFIDADGTCDPDYCVPLIQRLEQRRADVVLAGRLNAESQMPLIRKLGNVLFARLLGLVSGQALTDCASGFRVVRRSSLPYLVPLPNALHFTPAMSAICLLDSRLHIEEVPMPYKERIGRSKLRVLKDGLRFLYTILFTACCYTPIKTMMGVAFLIILLTALLLGTVLAAGVAPDIAALLGLGGAFAAIQALGTGVICHQLNYLLIGPRCDLNRAERILLYLLDYKRLMLWGTLLGLVGSAGLILAGLARPSSDLVRLIPPLLVLVIGASCALGGVIMRVIWAVNEKHMALLEEEDRLKSLPAVITEPALAPAPLKIARLVGGGVKGVGLR